MDDIVVANIALVAYPRCTASVISGVLDIFSTANHCVVDLYGDSAVFNFNIQIVSEDGRPLVASNNQPIFPDASFNNAGRLDYIIIPEIFQTIDKGQLDADAFASCAQWVRKQHDQGCRLASLSTGTFILAETGLLNGMTATTHSRMFPCLQDRYPAINVVNTELNMSDNFIISAGESLSYIDLSFYIIEKLGNSDIAFECEQRMALSRRYENGREASKSSTHGVKAFADNHSDFKVKQIQDWLARHHRTKFNLEKVAELFGMGPRNFKRRFKLATGVTPIAYVQELRIESAKNWLKMTNFPVTKITEKIGYDDFSSFSRLFKRSTGVTMLDYRKTTSSTACGSASASGW
ncbi:helix-turn-helix domain-containing protein [Pseudomonas sp. J452]|uniref:GlxA family transcriptional regulator n=1 Tax=Pseudomonas sp. J452 TaxID=2898441 RepID=UPI0021AD5D59|nr:helix-turn-helix domain-containing protein [Pseudomonas sp. J452]UUY08378.1 helix-turn-helix domain-containing protein [Pseudomonas sp. J452]